jgi:phage tail-like protein
MNRRTVLRPKFKELVLKRAYRPNSNLLEWCMDAMNNHKREEENLTVTLLNSRRDMISAWRIEKAMPIGWHIDELHAEDSKILMETITLTYDYFEVVNGLGKVVAPKEK